MNYYPLFRVKSWNNDVRCMSFYIFTRKEHRSCEYFIDILHVAQEKGLQIHFDIVDIRP